MTDLAAFLAARLDEDEQLARAAEAEPFPDKGFQRGTHIAYGLQATGLGLDYQGFALAWDPARVLADTAAKRAILQHVQAMQTTAIRGSAMAQFCENILMRLVAPYADHEDARSTITAEQRDAILTAYDIPITAIDEPDDGLVHWRGLDDQETFTPLGLFRPTRCGNYYRTATLGYPAEHVTCPKCRELLSIDEENR